MITALIILLLTRLLRHSPLCVPAARVAEARAFAAQNAMNAELCLFVDYGTHSGRERLVVWSFADERPLFTCPVAHGRGHSRSGRRKPQFSNEEGSWLSSLGRCRIAERYEGSFGTAYRLDGLEPGNSNMRRRNVVLHGYRRMNTRPIYPLHSVCSKGCVVVSDVNMRRLDSLLCRQQDVLLDCYCSVSPSHS